MCDRHFGIGADGLMLLEEAEGVDFKMVYFNSDGRESSMCGNGGRCITSFAKHLGLIQSEAEFLAIDGHHQSRVLDHGDITLHMKDVTELIAHETYFELNDIENDFLPRFRAYYGSDDFLLRLTSVFEGAKLLPALKNKADIMAKFNKLKPFAFDASWLSLTKEVIDEIHQLGVKVFTDLLGPLDTEINYIKAREMGVDLIQTDRMLMVQKTLSIH
jgi:hypothetical protein